MFLIRDTVILSPVADILIYTWKRKKKINEEYYCGASCRWARPVRGKLVESCSNF